MSGVMVACCQLPPRVGELELVIVGGVCEDDGSMLRNTSVIVDRTGVRAAYRKVHLWDRESLFFEPGAERPAEVVRVQAGASSNRMFIAACALEQAREKRTSERNDVFADRRPELYV